MWKSIFAGTAALVIAGSSLTYAQYRAGGEGPRQWRPNVEDMRAFSEARLAALKAGLVLTAEQEKAWPAFEQAARELARLRIERRSSAPMPAPIDPAEWMNRRATALTETGAALKKLSEATVPLYNSLDESQKQRFAILNRFGRPAHVHGRDHGLRGLRGWHGMHRTGAETFDHTLTPHRMMSPILGEERL